MRRIDVRDAEPAEGQKVPVRVRKAIAGVALGVVAGFGIGSNETLREPVVNTVTAPIDHVFDQVDADLRIENPTNHDNLPPTEK